MMVQDKIMDFFKEKGIADNIAADTDLFKGKYINSLFALEMVMYLESTFKIKLKNKDINEENFKTVNNIAALVERMGGR